MRFFLKGAFFFIKNSLLYKKYLYICKRFKHRNYEKQKQNQEN